MKRTVIILLLLGVLNSLSAQNENLQTQIRFYNKSIYYPDSTIEIEVTLINNNPEQISVKLSNSRVFNLDFEVRTASNVLLDHAEQYKIDKNSYQPVFYREISLLPGDRYSFTVNLKDFIDIDGPGMYTVTAHFFPHLQTEGTIIGSNPLNLAIRPGMGAPKIRTKIDEKTGEVLKATALSPDKVVDYTLRARQRSQWPKFFLYLDIESLLKKDPDRRRRYERLSESERLAMLENYKNSLIKEKTGEDILLIPDSFSIIQTEYTPERGTVLVEQKFVYSDYTEVKRYTYYLYNRDGIWYIEDYTVENIGTE